MSLSVTIWDVQHGSAAYIRTPHGKHIVVDLGIGRARNPALIFSPLRHLRDAYGISQLDEVIITHPHRDHLDDISQFDRMNPRVLHRPTHLSEAEIRAGNRPGDSSILDQYLAIHRRYNAPVSFYENPSEASVNGGVDIATFHPHSSPTSNLNNHSIVVFVTFAGWRICIPGDNEAASWEELLKDVRFREYVRGVDVWVASHHGRESGYHQEIFDLHQPFLVVISDGPVIGTSCADKYRVPARGLKVWSRGRGVYTDRYVLTTRSDGAIHMEVTPGSPIGSLAVSVD